MSWCKLEVWLKFVEVILMKDSHSNNSLYLVNPTCNYKLREIFKLRPDTSTDVREPNYIEFMTCATIHELYADPTASSDLDKFVDI